MEPKWTEHGGRKYTVLIYLNDDYEGGETHFKILDTKIKGNTGDIVFFKNMLKDSQQSDPNSIHSGTPIKSGEKWLLNLWIRDRPYNLDYSDSSFPCKSMIDEINERTAKMLKHNKDHNTDSSDNDLPSRKPPIMSDANDTNDTNDANDTNDTNDANDTNDTNDANEWIITN